MKCETCGSKNLSMQDRCIPCFKKSAILVHDLEKMRFDSRQDAELRDSIERHAVEYPGQREALQRAINYLEFGAPGTALTVMREARALAKKGT